MAIKLNKPVRRSCVILTDNRAEPRPHDTVTVSLIPDGETGGLIGFRPNRSHQEILLPLNWVYEQALLRDSENGKPKRRKPRLRRNAMLKQD